MTIPNYKPFHYGPEWEHWEGRNCAQCVKRIGVGTKHTCDIEATLYRGQDTDGTLRLGGERTTAQAASIADRLAWDGVHDFPARCAEFERKEGSSEENY